RWDAVKTELAKIVAACKGKTVKVIIETCYLTKEEIVKICELCVALKVRYIKTSTGYGTGGATVEIVDLMQNAIEKAPRDYDPALFPCQVKASGGIDTYAQAKALAENGAYLIGTSNAREIAETIVSDPEAVKVADIEEKTDEPAEELIVEVAAEEPAEEKKKKEKKA
ncbi:MAG: hypothetical protein LBS99_05380, partial [Clostridiales bacterium]|nr:hypothetical protein [Clostridiales bacterium]